MTTLKEKNYNAYIEQFRRKHIPKRYNQVKLLDELNNPDIDHFISISNRTDGKSINYIHALLNIAIEYDVGLMFLSRRTRQRAAYQTLIEEIIQISDVLERRHFNFITQFDYIVINYKDKTIGIVSDLNNAQDLKEYSNFIKDFPIVIYDEFLALEEDYVFEEWTKLKTIYGSIDRKKEYPLIVKPKIFYFGNAVNFESPILFGLEIFNILENHPMNTAKIYQYRYHVMLEINKNENANDERNTRAFGGDDDSMSTARFETNNYRIATDNDRNQIRKNPRHIFIKLQNEYLKVWFNRDTFDIILSIESHLEGDYQFNLQLKDNKAESTFLNPNYFDDNQIKKIDRGYYLFENNYSKNFITNDFNQLKELKLNKVIRESLREETNKTEIESKEQQLQDNYIEQTKKALMSKLWG